MVEEGVIPLALHDGRWRNRACSGMFDSLHKLEQLDFPVLIGSLAGLDNPATLECVVQAGIDANYDWPVLENLFFVHSADVKAIEALVAP